MLPFARYLLTLFTLFIGLGFWSGKKGKQEKHSASQQMSCSAPNRLTGSRNNITSKERSSERLDAVDDKDGVDDQVGSPTSKTQPIAIQSSRKRSSTVKSRTGSAYSLHSTTSAGSGSHRRLGHGTPHSGSRSVIGSFLSGSAGSGPSSTPKTFSKSHEAVWEQAFRNSCR